MEAELQRYSRLLRLAAPQAQFMVQLHERYKSQCEEWLEKQWADVSLLADTVGESLYHSEYSPQITEDYRICMALETELNSGLIELEERFFQSLGHILADVQAVSIPRVKATRQRACRNVLEIDRPSASVDLVAICDLLEISEFPESIADQLLAEYEIQITPVMVQLDRDLADRRASLFWLDMRLKYVEDDEYAAFQSDPVALRKVWREQRRAMLALGARLQEEIHRMNEDYAARLQAALGDSLGPTFESLWLASAYPGAFPDETDPRDVIGRLISSNALSEVRRADVAAQWNLYRQRYKSITQRIRKVSDNWYIQKSQLRLGFGFVDYRSDLRALQRQRLESNAELLDWISDSLSREELTDIKEPLRKNREEIKRNLKELSGEALQLN
jgi:hypothetical protein